MWMQVFWFNLISIVIPELLWLWYRYRCSKFLGGETEQEEHYRVWIICCWWCTSLNFADGVIIECKGYNIDKKKLYQYNKSAIIIEVNGKISAGNRIRELNIFCFLMTDKFEKENLQIKYFPTYDMWGYFMTNPTQGGKFRNFRNHVLGGNE